MSGNCISIVINFLRDGGRVLQPPCLLLMIIIIITIQYNYFYLPTVW